MWYLVLLPLVVLNISAGEIKRTKLYTCFAIWVACLFFWLAVAYCLEFLGYNVWMLLWAASLAFNAASMVCIAIMVRVFDDGGSEIRTRGLRGGIESQLTALGTETKKKTK